MATATTTGPGRGDDEGGQSSQIGGNTRLEERSTESAIRTISPDEIQARDATVDRGAAVPRMEGTSDEGAWPGQIGNNFMGHLVWGGGTRGNNGFGVRGGPSSSRRATITADSKCSSLSSSRVDDVVFSHGPRGRSDPMEPLPRGRDTAAPCRDPIQRAGTTKPKNIFSLPSHLLLFQRREPEGEHKHAMSDGRDSLIDEIMLIERSTNASLWASRDVIQWDAADEKRAAAMRMEESEAGRSGNILGRSGQGGAHASGSAAHSGPSSRRRVTRRASMDSACPPSSLSRVVVDDVNFGHGPWRRSDPIIEPFPQRREMAVPYKYLPIPRAAGDREDDEAEEISLIDEKILIGRSTNAALRDENRLDAADQKRAAVTRMEEPKAGRSGNTMGRSGQGDAHASGSAARNGSSSRRRVIRRATMDSACPPSSLSRVVDDVDVGRCPRRGSDPIIVPFPRRRDIAVPCKDPISRAAREREDDEWEKMSLIDEIMRLEQSTNAALRASRDEIQVLQDAADKKRVAVMRMERVSDVIARSKQLEGGRSGNLMGRLGWGGADANDTAHRGCSIHSSAGSDQDCQQTRHQHLSPRAPSSRRRSTISGDSSFSSLSLLGVDVDDVVVRHGLRRTSDHMEQFLPRSLKPKTKTSRRGDDDLLLNDDFNSTRRLRNRQVAGLSSSEREGRNGGGGGMLKGSKSLLDLINFGNGVGHRIHKDDTIKRSKSLIGLMNFGNGIGHRHSKDDTPEKNDHDNGYDKERDRLNQGDDDDSDDDFRIGPRVGKRESPEHSASKDELAAQMIHIHLATQVDKNNRIAELESLRVTNANRLSDLKSMLGTLEARSRSGLAQHASVVEGLLLRKKMLAEDVERRRELVTESERRLDEIEGRIKILDNEIEIKTGDDCTVSLALGGRDCVGRETSNIARLDGEIRLYRLRLQIHSQYTVRALGFFSNVIEMAKKNDTEGILFRKQKNLKHDAEDRLGRGKDDEERKRQYFVEGIALDVDIQLNDLERMIKEIDMKVNEYKFLGSDIPPPATLSSTSSSATWCHHSIG
jgi:hypothetical protein